MQFFIKNIKDEKNMIKIFIIYISIVTCSIVNADPYGESVLVPNHSIGDTYLTEVASLTEQIQPRINEKKIVGIEQGKIIVESKNLNNKSSKPRIIEYTHEWNLIQSMNSDGNGMYYSPPLKYFDYPLFPGKTWQQTSVEVNIKTSLKRQYIISSEVNDWENITGLVGSFKALKITTKTELRDLSTGEITYFTDLSWYVPEIGKSIKSETITKKQDGSETKDLINLTSYQIKSIDKNSIEPENNDSSHKKVVSIVQDDRQALNITSLKQDNSHTIEAKANIQDIKLNQDVAVNSLESNFKERIYLIKKYYDNNSDKIFNNALAITLIFGIVGVILGLTDTAVFYMDNSDLYKSFTGWAILIFCFIAYIYINNNLLIYFGIVSSILAIAYSSYITYIYNQRKLLLAIPVGIAKVLLGFFYIFNWISAIFPAGQSNAQRNRNRATAFIIIGLMTALMHKLINGEEVYQNNNWNLPDDLG